MLPCLHEQLTAASAARRRVSRTDASRERASSNRESAWGRARVRGTERECVVTRVACVNLRMHRYPVTSDAREAREIVGPLRQRGGRAVRLLEARGGGWAREERLSGEPYVYRTHVHCTRKRCCVWCTVSCSANLCSTRPGQRREGGKAGRDLVASSPGQAKQSSVTEASADVRESGGADLSTPRRRPVHASASVRF
jgi:hypothetical protein